MSGEAIIQTKERQVSEKVNTPKNSGGEARVDYEAGVTLNMGDFESARVSIRISLPCEARPSKLDKMFEFGRGWVSDRLEQEIDLLTRGGDE